MVCRILGSSELGGSATKVQKSTLRRALGRCSNLFAPGFATGFATALRRQPTTKRAHISRRVWRVHMILQQYQRAGREQTAQTLRRDLARLLCAKGRRNVIIVLLGK